MLRIEGDFLDNVPLVDIDLGDRRRIEYGDLSELASDIERNGLINPIAICEHPDSHEFRWLLVAGGRRYKACQILQHTHIMCRGWNRTMEPLEIRTLELAENLKRLDMTPAEEIKLKNELHQMQIKLYGEKVGKSPDAPGVTASDTARMLNTSAPTLSRNLKVAKVMEAFPDLGWDRCKTFSDVEKLAKNVTTSIVRQEQAKEVEESYNGQDERFDAMSNAFVIGDFFAAAATLPGDFFDFVEIDPPYAIDLTRQKKDYGYEGYNEIDAKVYMDGDPETCPSWLGMNELFRRCYRIMAPNSWGICWFGPDPWFELIYQAITTAGFGTTRLTGVWAKGEADDTGLVEVTSGQAHQPNSRLANAVEHFFYFWKGRPVLGHPGSTNHFGCRPVPPKQKYHPTQRPLTLMRDLLSTFCAPGSKVLVPFAGSGATMLAAFDSHMKPVGYDLSRNYKDAYILEVQNILKEGSKIGV